MKCTALLVGVLCLLVLGTATAQHGPGGHGAQRMQRDRQVFEGEENWLYNDLDAGLDAAKKSGKPLFVVVRCVP